MGVNKKGKITSVSFILMLIISTVAFAYMIGGEVKNVEATVVLSEESIPQGQTGITVLKGQEFVFNGKQYTALNDLLYRPDDFNTESLISNGMISLNQPLDTANIGESPSPSTAIPTPVGSFGAAAGTTIEAGAAIAEYKIQPLTVSVNGKNVQVAKVYDDGGLYAIVGKDRVDMSDALADAGYLADEGIIDSSKYEYKTGQITYATTKEGVVQYRTRTYSDPAGERTIIESSLGNNDWTEVATNEQGEYTLPDGYTYDAKTKTFSGGTGEVLSTKGEFSYIKIGDTVYKQGSDSVLQKIDYSSGLPAGSIPTTFDAAGNPTQWTSPSGAMYNNKAEFMGRGEVKAFGTEWSFGAGHILQGLQWAGIAAGLTLTIGQLFIKDQKELMAMTAGITAGIMVGKTTYALLGKGGAGGFIDGKKIGEVTVGTSKTEIGTNWLSSPWTSAAIGAATAWLVYNAMWEKESVSYETVTFNCLPWEAPHGGKDCELCNDADLPCSEYRCKSLGQSCEIVNKGTKEERCVNINPRDSSPPVIKPNKEDLSEGYIYDKIVEMPPTPGFHIVSEKTTTGCIPAYTAITFGVTTNEPSQCKIDITPKGNYSQMTAYMGGDNLYKYNHTEILNLPSSADLKNSSIKLQNGRELTFYMRCRDAAGNTNEGDYALTVCVDPSPDNTAPLVQGTSIENKGCVPADSENATVQFYINEPSECRWDYYDKDFEQMNNNMSCSTSAIEINAIQSFTCTTLLKGVGRDGNNFYVRCKDQPEGTINESKRNTNKESYIFNLRRSNQLKLKIVQPNETIYGVVRPTPVELYAETLFGCEDNKAICYYSATGAENSFVQFFDTDKSDGVHTQRLDLNDGTYTYYIRCVDSGGNVANTTTSFRVNIDTNAPVVARAYEEEGYLKIVTPLNSECVYNSESCDYLFNEGTSMPYANSTTHVTEWFPDKKYFIKCRDEYRSEPVDCSLVVRPTENFLGV